MEVEDIPKKLLIITLLTFGKQPTLICSPKHRDQLFHSILAITGFLFPSCFYFRRMVNIPYHYRKEESYEPDYYPKKVLH